MEPIYAENIIRARNAAKEEECVIENHPEKGYIIVKYEKMELDEREFLDGQIVMLIPKLLQPMSEDLIQIKYPNPEWYMKNGIYAGEFDVSVILKQYHKLEEQLKEAAKKYVGKISPLEIESHLQCLLTPFQEYIKELILYAITDAVETEEFQKLNKAKELQIRVGECLEPGNLIYLEQKDKDREKITPFSELCTH